MNNGQNIHIYIRYIFYPSLRTTPVASARCTLSRGPSKRSIVRTFAPSVTADSHTLQTPTPASRLREEEGVVSYVSHSIYPCHPRFTRARDGICRGDGRGRLYTMERSALPLPIKRIMNRGAASFFPVSPCSPWAPEEIFLARARNLYQQ